MCIRDSLTNGRQLNRNWTRDLSGLHDDQPLQQRVVVMLEREEDDAVAGNDEVARHLQRKRGLAQTRPSAQKHQLTRTKPAGQQRVQVGEAGRPDLGAGWLIGTQHFVGLFKDGAQRLEPTRGRVCVRHCHGCYSTKIRSSFSCSATYPPPVSNRPWSKRFRNSRSTLSTPLRFFSMVITTQLRKRSALATS